MVAEENNVLFEEVSTDCINTKNESLGLVCKRFQEVSELSSYSDSFNIISLIVCQVNNMLSNECNQVEVNFNSVSCDNALLFGESKVNFSLNVVGLTETDNTSANELSGISCKDLEEDSERSNLKIECMDDAQLGLYVKKHISDYTSLYNTEDDITQYIFSNLLYYIKEKKIGESFAIVLPVGSMVVRVLFESELERITVH